MPYKLAASFIMLGYVVTQHWENSNKRSRFTRPLYNFCTSGLEEFSLSPNQHLTNFSHFAVARKSGGMYQLIQGRGCDMSVRMMEHFGEDLPFMWPVYQTLVDFMNKPIIDIVMPPYHFFDNLCSLPFFQLLGWLLRILWRNLTQCISATSSQMLSLMKLLLMRLVWLADYTAQT